MLSALWGKVIAEVKAIIRKEAFGLLGKMELTPNIVLQMTTTTNT